MDDDDERRYELRKLEQHAIEYYRALQDGFDGDYETWLRVEKGF